MPPSRARDRKPFSFGKQRGIIVNAILDSRFAGPGSPTDLQVGYFVLRIMLGVNLTFHGVMRPITGMNAFVEQWVPTFTDTFVPMSLVRISLYFIPVAEFILGVLMLLGLFTRLALIGGVLVFALLLAGHAVRSNWGGIHLVMQYVLYYAFLFALRSQNWLALDNRRRSS